MTARNIYSTLEAKLTYKALWVKFYINLFLALSKVSVPKRKGDALPCGHRPRQSGAVRAQRAAHA